MTIYYYNHIYVPMKHRCYLWSLEEHRDNIFLAIFTTPISLLYIMVSWKTTKSKSHSRSRSNRSLWKVTLQTNAIGITVYRDNFAPDLIFALFTPSAEGEIKSGLIELHIKDYVRNSKVCKFKTGWISLGSLKAKIRLGEFEAVYSILLHM